MSNVSKLTENCIHCRLCTKKCAFLQKYKLDLQSFAEHPELAYHCFLCSDCSCAGKLHRSGVENVHHVLVDILGTEEESELSFKSIWNRAKHRFI